MGMNNRVQFSVLYYILGGISIHGDDISLDENVIKGAIYKRSETLPFGTITILILAFIFLLRLILRW
jgi:hypothetical protein